eukprot:11185036-Lingulodinium_polyedra.AAC.1
MAPSLRPGTVPSMQGPYEGRRALAEGGLDPLSPWPLSLHSDVVDLPVRLTLKYKTPPSPACGTR